MQPSTYNIQEQNAAKAFNSQSAIFDDIYSSNLTIQYKRKRVRENVERLLPADSNILELNAGTGEDAIYFASKGHNIHATDIAEEMQNVLKKKVAADGFENKVSTELCSFNNLKFLKNKIC